MRTIEVDLESAVPVYQQIADGLRGLIAQGELGAGDELPGVRQLGAQVGVNFNTVANAYRVLAEEGLVELRQGAAARVLGGVRRGAAAEPLLDDEARRKLSDLFSRWVLRGAKQRDVHRALREAAEEYFK